ncbi:hypothetical protein HG535_0E02190 [Zygotorulaspora mrakii]|uniref:DNA damage checkpoint control protein RAD17 n=1 Tax=Zygotorulaspora mrakii TaxID=42260 RepID=A0A7H9B389_ZYGMR|nr:uncharacterized protein HG535_0E02190 [Zygotorulaspora mrakii]QLG73135.1 hypothetical protein HG535_0E02190 [Zygotorulaspora mrakii]
MKVTSKSSKFSASTVHLEHITTALNCVTPFGGKAFILTYIDADGLSFIGTYNRVVRIQLFLSKELFISYTYENDSSDHTKFCVRINQVLDSVNVANRNIDDIVECTLSHNGEGSPFVLIFEDSYISERVTHETFLANEMDNTGFDLDRDRIRFECMIKGDILHTALKDLKEIGGQDECYLYAELREGGQNIFAIISKSKLGLSKIVLPSAKTILEKLEVFDEDFTTLCYGKPVIALFDFNLFDKLRMSIKISSKVLLRLDAHGVLNVNVLSLTEDILLSSNKSKATSSNSRLQLPKDYPGIVIELSLMEKEITDENSMRDVEIFMETNELGEPIKPVIYKKKIVGSISSAPTNAAISRELGKLNGTANAQDAEIEGEHAIQEEAPFMSNGLPRFF